MRQNDENGPRAEVPAGRTTPSSLRPPVETVIVGGSEETRLLLRGLVRLHHHRVLAEAATAQDLGPGAATDSPQVLLLVADGEGEEWVQELGIVLQRRPGILPLLIVPDPTSELSTRARGLGIRGLLNRPFAIRDLVSAIEAVARGEEVPAGGAGRGPPPVEQG